MSLNHLVNEEIADRDKLDIYANSLSTKRVTFDKDEVPVNGEVTTVKVGDQNQLVYKNETGTYATLNKAFQIFYQQLADPVVIIPSDGEKSMLDTNGSIGTLIRIPNSNRRGTHARSLSHGRITASPSNKQARIRFYSGVNIIAESPIFTLPNLQAGSFYMIELDMLVYQTGVAGVAVLKSFGTFTFIDQSSNSKIVFLDSTNNTTFQTVAAEVMNVTFEWIDQDAGLEFTVDTLRLEVNY